jgi:hypothetical protein
MPPTSDWLSWEFWAETAHAVRPERNGELIAGVWAGYVANRESIVSLATLIAGVIGIPLLAIRTIAANRSARPALEQAKTAADQAKTAAERHAEQTTADRTLAGPACRLLAAPRNSDEFSSSSLGRRRLRTNVLCGAMRAAQAHAQLPARIHRRLIFARPPTHYDLTMMASVSGREARTSSKTLTYPNRMLISLACRAPRRSRLGDAMHWRAPMRGM